MGMSSWMPIRSLTKPSSIYNEILVCFKSLIPDLSKTDFGMILTFVPRLHNVFLNLIFLKEQDTVKLPRSLSYGGKLFKITVSTSSNPLSFEIISFKHFV
jgi:hypothetical protein